MSEPRIFMFFEVFCFGRQRRSPAAVTKRIFFDLRDYWLDVTYTFVQDICNVTLL